MIDCRSNNNGPVCSLIGQPRHCFGHHVNVWIVGWFLKRFHLIFLKSSWFPRKKKNLLHKASTKCYQGAKFHDIWSWWKSSKFAIQWAISAKIIMILKSFLCKNTHYIVNVLVPNFHLSGRSSSFFLAFFLRVYGDTF